MSSTNRINAADRNVADYYVTPIPAVSEFLIALRQDYRAVAHAAEVNPYASDVMVLDPCAGGDSEHPMSYPVAIGYSSNWNILGIETVDSRPDSLARTKADYLALPAPLAPFDIAITNPPFNLALPIIKKCLQEVRPGGLVIMLLRLNFFGSQERSSWLRQNMPAACYVHSKRMKFLNTGGTDSIEYMHAVWVVGHHPGFTQLRIISQ